MGRAEVADVHDYGELAISATSVESEVVMPTKAHVRTPINHVASVDRRVVGEEGSARWEVSKHSVRDLR
jgi:hypothetical protein